MDPFHYVEGGKNSNREVFEMPPDCTIKGEMVRLEIAARGASTRGARLRVDFRRVQKYDVKTLIELKRICTLNRRSILMDPAGNRAIRNLFRLLGLPLLDGDDGMAGKGAKLIPPSGPRSAAEAERKPDEDEL